jgi:signal transduction histidine kinase
MQSIKFKILTSFLIVIAVLVISETFFVAMHFVSIKRYQDITDNMIAEYKIIETTTNLINSFNNLVKYANDNDRISKYSQNRIALENLLLKLDGTIVDNESQIAFEGLKNNVNNVVNACDNGVAAVFQGNFLEVTAHYNEANHQNMFVQENTANLVLKELQYTEKLRVEIAKNQLISEVTGSTLFLLVILGCIWYSFSFSQRLISPLTKLTRLAKIIEDGNLNATMEKNLLAGGDEVASLANSFNSMVNSLKDNIRRLREYNEALIRTKKIVIDRETKISQLQEINKMKDEFMNIVTHELKTPLIPIVGLSEMMAQKKEILSEEFRGYVDIIHEEAIKLTSLIRQMLLATRTENGDHGKSKEAFKIGEFVLAEKTSLNELAKRTNSKIEFNLAEKGMEVESDKERISQVIYNLVDNAVKYGPRGQTITVSVSKLDKNTAKVAISDQGKGIPPELREKLFLKFSQLEPSASRSQEGMGLGLYICKKNIEYLGGQIGFESELGRGSTFYFTLPLKQGGENGEKKVLKKSGIAKNKKNFLFF